MQQTFPDSIRACEAERPALPSSEIDRPLLSIGFACQTFGYIAFWAWLIITAQEGEDAPADQQKAPPSLTGLKLVEADLDPVRLGRSAIRMHGGRSIEPKTIRERIAKAQRRRWRGAT